MTTVFVTATGTDVGKTFVAAGLIRHWRTQGRVVEAIKPVVTGFDPEQPAGSDPAVLLDALGRPATLPEIARIAPFRYAAPLSPDMAARREGRALDFDMLLDFCRTRMAAAKDMLLIEGVGGVMVPLDGERTVLDWIEALAVPLVLVTGSYLGSLSHTLTCLDVLSRRGLAVSVLVVSETAGSTVSLQDTADTLRRFTKATPLVMLPRERNDEVFAAIAGLLDHSQSLRG